MGATAAYNSQIYVTSQPAVGFTNEAMTDSGDHTLFTITDQGKRYLDKNTPVVVQTSPDGTAWTAATGYTLYRVNARVEFANAQTAGTQVRLASGKYFVVALIGECSSAEFDGKLDTTETTVFSNVPAKTYIPTLFSGTFKTGTFWLNKAHVEALRARDLLVVAFDAAGGDRYEGYCFTTDSDIKNAIAGAVTEDLSFILTNEFFIA